MRHHGTGAREAEWNATAQLGAFHDAKDADSRLDLADASLRFHSDTQRYTWRFNTYERFRLANGGTFVLFIDSVGGPRWDFRLYAWDDPGSSGIFCDGGHRPGSGGGDRFRPDAMGREAHVGLVPRKGIQRASEEARADILDLSAWSPVVPDMEMLAAAWSAEERFGLSFWDSLIVAAAQVARCNVLLTEDLHHDMDLEGVRVINPFRVAPGIA